MRVLHISADFPDPLAPGKTRAISGLLELVPEIEHIVYSINRVDWRLGVSALSFGSDWRAVAYGAPPKGLMLKRRLDRLSAWILEDCAARNLRPDVVHAHKLSVDAVVGETVARALGARLIVTSQGNSDTKILGARPDLRPLWRRIWRAAETVFVFAPWTERRLVELLGTREGPTRLLPCPIAHDRIRSPRLAGPRVVSAFHLAGHANKNAALLIDAATAVGRRCEATLEIAGGGDPEAFARLQARAAAGGAARLIGPVAPETMPGFLNGAAGFAMPSRRESFGMVFVEALFAGTPVLHAKGVAIDGWFATEPAVAAVPADDVDAVADGLARFAKEERMLKERIARLQESGALVRFTRNAIARTYRDALFGDATEAAA